MQPPIGILTFDGPVERLTVIARDPDGDALQFIWSLPPLAVGDENTTIVDGTYISRLDLAYDDALDGELVILTILDAQEARDLVWQVEGL